MAESKEPEDRPGSSSENVQIPENLSKEEYVKMAKAAKEEKRFKDMVKIMEKVVVGLSETEELTVEERELFAVAYKTVFFTLQTVWLKVSKEEEIADQLEDKTEVLKVRDTMFEIEAEITELFDEGILKLLKDKLESSASTSESKVYYLTLRGDYCKQLLKYKYGYDLEKLKADAIEAYGRAAQEIAKADFHPTDPTRLRVALSIATFYHDILNASREAFDMAREAHDQAISKLDGLEGEALQETEALLERLRDFLARVLAHEEEVEAAKEFVKSFADADLLR
ncbi:hypothetical protein LguiA_023602 [Lonicera macranthoides]